MTSHTPSLKDSEEDECCGSLRLWSGTSGSSRLHLVDLSQHRGPRLPLGVDIDSLEKPPHLPVFRTGSLEEPCGESCAIVLFYSRGDEVSTTKACFGSSWLWFSVMEVLQDS